MPYEYKAVVTRVVDADTFDIEFDLGFSIKISQRTRLCDVDAPELVGEDKELGIACKKWVESQLADPNVIVRTRKDKRGKYGRVLVEVYDTGLGSPSLNIRIKNKLPLLRKAGYEGKKHD